MVGAMMFVFGDGFWVEEEGEEGGKVMCVMVRIRVLVVSGQGGEGDVRAVMLDVEIGVGVRDSGFHRRRQALE